MKSLREVSVATSDKSEDEALAAKPQAAEVYKEVVPTARPPRCQAAKPPRCTKNRLQLPSCKAAQSSAAAMYRCLEVPRLQRAAAQSKVPRSRKVSLLQSASILLRSTADLKYSHCKKLGARKPQSITAAKCCCCERAAVRTTAAAKYCCFELLPLQRASAQSKVQKKHHPCKVPRATANRK